MVTTRVNGQIAVSKISRLSMRQTRIIGVCQLLQLLVEEEVPPEPQQLHLQQLHLPLVKVYHLGLEINGVMTKTTTLHVSLMVGIAAIIINLIGIGIAQLANAFLEVPPKPQQLHLLVKVLEVKKIGSGIIIVMTKTTMPLVNLMVGIAVIILQAIGTGIAVLANVFLANLDKD